ncbi:MAG TPA: hypothetical protein VF070_46880 [Streptosporangiaceae bacterium]
MYEPRRRPAVPVGRGPVVSGPAVSGAVVSGPVVSGRHARLPAPAGLRRVCLATLITLVVQFSLGMILNLYVPVPASDQHASYVQEIRTAPLALTIHVLIGLMLIGAAIAAAIRAIRMRDRSTIALAAGGLGAIVGAFGAGELFVRNGQSSASLTMAILTGIALVCYIGALVRTISMPRQPSGLALPIQTISPSPRPAAPPAYAAYDFPRVPEYPGSVPLPRRTASGPMPRLGNLQGLGNPQGLDNPQTGPQPRLGNPRTGPQPRLSNPQGLGNPQTGPQPRLSRPPGAPWPGGRGPDPHGRR